MNRRERGVALPLVLVALGAVGLLVAGLFHVALLEARQGRASVQRVQALGLAELGAWEALAGVRHPDSLGGLLGGRRPGVGTWRGRVTALGGDVYLIRITATSGAGIARQTVALLARRRPAGAATALRPIREGGWIQRP